MTARVVSVGCLIMLAGSLHAQTPASAAPASNRQTTKTPAKAVQRLRFMATFLRDRCGENAQHKITDEKAASKYQRYEQRLRA